MNEIGKRNLLEMKGMSKWVETAMRPVPERSHMLKTWPTKAGPPSLRPEGKPETLTEEGKVEALVGEWEESE